MNIKFFILGLFVLVTILQVEAEPDPSKSDEADQKHEKRHATQGKVNGDAASSHLFERSISSSQHVPQKHSKQAFQEALKKLYPDSSKSYLPSYESVYGDSAQGPAGRRMNGEPAQMPNMMQPPAGQPGFLGYQNGANADPLKMAPGGYNGYYPYPGQGAGFQQPFMRRNGGGGGGGGLWGDMKKVQPTSPDRLKKIFDLIMRARKSGGGGPPTARRLFSPPEDDEDESDEDWQGPQAEFRSNMGPIAGRRSNMDSEPEDVGRLLTDAIMSLATVIAYVKKIMRGGTKNEVYEMAVTLFEAFVAGLAQLRS